MLNLKERWTPATTRSALGGVLGIIIGTVCVFAFNGKPSTREKALQGATKIATETFEDPTPPVEDLPSEIVPSVRPSTNPQPEASPLPSQLLAPVLETMRSQFLENKPDRTSFNIQLDEYRRLSPSRRDLMIASTLEGAKDYINNRTYIPGGHEAIIEKLSTLYAIPGLEANQNEALRTAIREMNAIFVEEASERLEKGQLEDFSEMVQGTAKGQYHLGPDVRSRLLAMIDRAKRDLADSQRFP